MDGTKQGKHICTCAARGLGIRPRNPPIEATAAACCRREPPPAVGARPTTRRRRRRSFSPSLVKGGACDAPLNHRSLVLALGHPKRQFLRGDVRLAGGPWGGVRFRGL
ncbi:hypothetical protein [Oryza sativa Japonica Group]|uniref:Uncharacterized protein n=1 Tax=Oryza sativa subsp. japonica TaxID=39947 RepID=Q5QNC6_ORYSJ|nr:hypothetical protein [Oryza sativa Japonica Group]